MDIEAVVTIDIDDDVNPKNLISSIQSAISSINGVPTKINIQDVDNPQSLFIKKSISGVDDDE